MAARLRVAPVPQAPAAAKQPAAPDAAAPNAAAPPRHRWQSRPTPIWRVWQPFMTKPPRPPISPICWGARPGQRQRSALRRSPACWQRPRRCPRRACHLAAADGRKRCGHCAGLWADDCGAIRARAAQGLRARSFRDPALCGVCVGRRPFPGISGRYGDCALRRLHRRHLDRAGRRGAGARRRVLLSRTGHRDGKLSPR